jgi:S1-C subfamily serine protease
MGSTLTLFASGIFACSLAVSSCAAQPVVKERPNSMPAVELGGTLAGGELSLDEWDSMVERVAQSAFKVVVLTCEGREIGSGSGFNIGRYVVTNEHVIKDAERVELVAPDNSRVRIERWVAAQGDDLALLEPEERLQAPAVTLSPVDPISGDLVAAVGFPLGGEKTTRRARVLERLEADQDLSSTYAISTTASVQPGDSGGVLVNANGRVVAITTAIALKDNVSLGVPVSRLQRLIDTAKFPTGGGPCLG